MGHMTRKGTYILTAVAALLFALLSWAFADDQFTGTFWNTKAIMESSSWTYAFLMVIVLAGVYQARKLPAEGVTTATTVEDITQGQTDDPRVWKLLLGNVYMSLFWLPIRFFVGREWVAAGEHKLRNDAWMSGGTALKGFWTNAVTTPEGRPSAPAGAYGWFQHLLQYMLTHEWYTWFAKLIAIGEFLIGIGLILGALVGLAAFFGTLLNFNFMLAGSASTNPVLFGLGVLLVLGWKVAGYFGLDRVLLPALGAPWKMGSLFKGHQGEPLLHPRHSHA
jgi:thiosulfate dehydrogenase [quinone] large subunit